MSEKFDIEQIDNYSFDAATILNEIENAADEAGLPRYSNQLCLFHRKETNGPMAQFLSFTGSMHPEKNKTGILVNQSEFTEIHPLLKGTYTEEVCSKIRELTKFPIGRVRLLALDPKTCYGWHVDPDLIRYHIPLKTFNEAFFVVENSVYRMPINGALYTIVSTKPHTAINSALNKRRVHLVFDTYTQEQIENSPFTTPPTNPQQYDYDNIY